MIEHSEITVRQQFSPIRHSLPPSCPPPAPSCSSQGEQDVGLSFFYSQSAEQVLISGLLKSGLKGDNFVEIYKCLFFMH